MFQFISGNFTYFHFGKSRRFTTRIEQCRNEFTFRDAKNMTQTELVLFILIKHPRTFYFTCKCFPSRKKVYVIYTSEERSFAQINCKLNVIFTYNGRETMAHIYYALKMHACKFAAIFSDHRLWAKVKRNLFEQTFDRIFHFFMNKSWKGSICVYV